MADPNVISAVFSGIATVMTAGGGLYLAWRQGRAIRAAEEVSRAVEKVKEDQHRGFQQLGQAAYAAKDDLNTLKAVQSFHGQVLAATSGRLMEQTPTQPMMSGPLASPAATPSVPRPENAPPRVEPIPTGSQPGFKR